MLTTLSWSSHAVIFLTTVLCQHHLATCWLLGARPEKDIKILKYSPAPVHLSPQPETLTGRTGKYISLFRTREALQICTYVNRRLLLAVSSW